MSIRLLRQGPSSPAADPSAVRAHHLDPELAAGMLWLPDAGRAMGIRVVGGRGVGKSRLLGRIIGWTDFARGVPLVILDPVGGTLEELLDRLRFVRARTREQLLSRIRYVDMAGGGDRVVAWPLYHRLPGESLYAMSQRFLDVVAKMDVNLRRAAIQGWPALHRLGTHAGVLLGSLGWQVTEAEALVTDPAFREHALGLVGQAGEPEVQEAVAFFRQDFPHWRSDRTGSFLSKLTIFGDPPSRAMFGASSPGIDWQEVVDRRQAVLLDFRNVHSAEEKRFRLAWVFASVLDFIRRRPLRPGVPLSLIVDELSYLLASNGTDDSPLAEDFGELIDRQSRNRAAWVTLAHQELWQLDITTRKRLMSLGTQILGRMTDREATLELAGECFPYVPDWVRKTTLVGSPRYGMSERTEEFTPQQQQELGSQRFRELPRFQFLVGVAEQEGTLPRAYPRVSIARFDRGRFVDRAFVDGLREQLVQGEGRPVAQIQAEIAARREAAPGGSATPNQASLLGESARPAQFPAAFRRRTPP